MNLLIIIILKNIRTCRSSNSLSWRYWSRKYKRKNWRIKLSWKSYVTIMKLSYKSYVRRVKLGCKSYVMIIKLSYKSYVRRVKLGYKSYVRRIKLGCCKSYVMIIKLSSKSNVGRIKLSYKSYVNHPKRIKRKSKLYSWNHKNQHKAYLEQFGMDLGNYLLRLMHRYRSVNNKRLQKLRKIECNSYRINDKLNNRIRRELDFCNKLSINRLWLWNLEIKEKNCSRPATTTNSFK